MVLIIWSWGVHTFVTFLPFSMFLHSANDNEGHIGCQDCLPCFLSEPQSVTHQVEAHFGMNQYCKAEMRSWGLLVLPWVNGGLFKEIQPHHQLVRILNSSSSPCPDLLQSCSWWLLGQSPYGQGHHGVCWRWQCWQGYSSWQQWQHWWPWLLLKVVWKRKQLQNKSFWQYKKKWKVFTIKQTNLLSQPCGVHLIMANQGC